MSSSRTVAGGGNDADAPAVDRQPTDGAGHGGHAVSVVGVVEQHAEGVLVIKVHAARRLVEVGGKGAQALPDVLQADAHGVSDGRGKHRVLNVVDGVPLDRGRNLPRPQKRDVLLALVKHDHAAVEPLLQRHGPPLVADVPAHQLVLPLEGNEDRLARALGGHRRHPFVVGVQHTQS